MTLTLLKLESSLPIAILWDHSRYMHSWPKEVDQISPGNSEALVILSWAPGLSHLFPCTLTEEEGICRKGRKSRTEAPGDRDMRSLQRETEKMPASFLILVSHPFLWAVSSSCLPYFLCSFSVALKTVSRKNINTYTDTAMVECKRSWWEMRETERHKQTERLIINCF